MYVTPDEMAKRLRELRLKAGFSQSSVAKALPCSRSCYSYIESGSSRLYTDTLLKLAAIFQIPVEEFFKSPGTEDGKKHRTKRLRRLPAEKISGLSEKEKELITVLRVQKERNPDWNAAEELKRLAQERNGAGEDQSLDLPV